MEAMRKNSMNFGVILGLTLVVLTTLMYAIDINTFTSSWAGIVTIVIITGFGAVAASKQKKANGGFLSFKESFTCFFITVVLGVFISTLYSILLFNFIDPEAKTVIMENLIKKTIGMMEKFGAKPADINAMSQEMQKTDSFGLWGQLKGFLFNIILYSIIGLITALIVRRERPQSI
jgi:tetrahydromethanopterin S-methyltransferase subunit B